MIPSSGCPPWQPDHPRTRRGPALLHHPPGHDLGPPNRRRPMILKVIAEKLKRRAKADFKGRHYEATLILQAVSWYLRYPLSYRDIEELFLERGLEVDH